MVEESRKGMIPLLFIPMTRDPGDLALDSACVRKGTLVLVSEKAPLSPPVNGGKLRVASDLAVCDVKPRVESIEATTETCGSMMSFGGGSTSPPRLTAAMRSSSFALQPIETLRPGDRVLGHDGFPHPILRVIGRGYRGVMIGLRTASHTATLWMTADHYVLCAKRTTDYGAGRSWKHVPAQHFDRARDMRREMTSAERVLWKALRVNRSEAKFRRQHPLGPYIADFYSWSTGLVLEVDGNSHFNDEAEAYDRERTKYMEGLGLTVLRFTNLQVLRELPAVLETVSYALKSVKPSGLHHLEWRRADSLRRGDVVYCPAMVSDSLKTGTARLPPVDGGIEGGNSSAAGRADASPGFDAAIERGTLTLVSTEISELVTEHTNETVYDLEVDGTHSFVTEVCVVHNCGGGTRVCGKGSSPFLTQMWLHDIAGTLNGRHPFNIPGP